MSQGFPRSELSCPFESWLSSLTKEHSLSQKGPPCFSFTGVSHHWGAPHLLISFFFPLPPDFECNSALPQSTACCLLAFTEATLQRAFARRAYWGCKGNLCDRDSLYMCKIFGGKAGLMLIKRTLPSLWANWWANWDWNPEVLGTQVSANLFWCSVPLLTKEQRTVLVFLWSSTGGDAIFQVGSSLPPLMSNFILCCLLQ